MSDSKSPKEEKTNSDPKRHREIGELLEDERSIDNHRLIAMIGAGGMGTVYLAQQPGLDRPVALKTIKTELFKSSTETRNFIFEARVAGSLEHPNILPVHWMGVDSEGRPYYTMKLVEGTPLSGILAKLAAGDTRAAVEYSLNRLVRIFLGVCSAVSYTHSQGIVHRDIKPDNILLGDHGEIYLVDWGMARRLDEETDEKEILVVADKEVSGGNGVPDESRPPPNDIADTRKIPWSGKDKSSENIVLVPCDTRPGNTPTGVFIGTPAYSSPEQASGNSNLADERSDIYGLGAVLYEIICLRPPVLGDSITSTLLSVIQGLIPLPEEVAKDREVPAELSAVAMKALSRQPDDRFQNVSEMVAELEAWVDGRDRWKTIAEFDFSDLPKTDGPPPGWVLITGAWRVQDGALSPVGRSHHVIHLDMPMPRDVRVEVTAEIESGTWGEISIILSAPPKERLPSFDAGYAMQFGADDHRHIKIARNNADIYVLPMVDMPKNTAVTIIAERRGDIIRMEYDGRELIRYRDYFPLSGNRVGLYAFSPGVRIHSVKVSAAGMDLNVSSLAVGDRLSGLGYLAEARSVYHEIAEAHPQREEGAVARYKAGLCALRLDDLEGSGKDFSCLNNPRFGPMYCLGRALLAQHSGDVGAELSALSEAFKSYPGHRLLDDVLHEVRTRAIERILSPAPAQALPLVTLVFKNCVPEYERVTDVLLKLRPPLVNTGHVLGQGVVFRQWLKMPIGRDPRAAALFTRLILDEAEEAGETSNLWKTAKEVLDKYRTPRTECSIICTVVEYLTRWGYVSDACGILDEYLASEPSPAERRPAVRHYIDALLREGDFTAACGKLQEEMDCRDCEADYDFLAESLRATCDALVRKGNLQEAGSLAQILSELFPTHPRATFLGLSLMGRINRLTDNAPAAIDYYRQAAEQVDAGPDFVASAMLEVADVLRTEGYLREAEDTLQEIFSLSHGPGQRYGALLALIFFQDGRGDRAGRALRSLEEKLRRYEVDRPINRFIRSQFPQRLRPAPHPASAEETAESLFFYGEYHRARSIGGTDENYKKVDKTAERELAYQYYEQVRNLAPAVFSVPAFVASKRLSEAGEVIEPPEATPVTAKEAAALQELINRVHGGLGVDSQSRSTSAFKH